MAHPQPSPPRTPKKGQPPRRWSRELTSPWRVLPDFLIVGAQKAGTTSLHAYLSEHPQVIPPVQKEVRYFSHVYERGPGWYRAHFPTRARVRREARRLGRRVITGEASPDYLFRPHAARRIAADLPDAKFIALLRDPVARAYSHYQHYARGGRITMTWEEALDYEAARLPGELERVLRDERYRSEVYGPYGLRARGLYAEQLERLFAVVARERVLVLKSEDFFADEQAQFDAVCRFLDIEPVRLGGVAPRNQGRYERAIPREAELRAFFEPHNRRLYDLLGRDFGW